MTTVIPPRGRRTRKDLALWLESQGFGVSELTLVSEGDYTPEDSDWNYKDIAHVNHVHQATRVCSAFMHGKTEGAIQTQSIFGFWVPTVNFVYEKEPFLQVYAFTLFFYVFVLETLSESIGPMRTRTTTHYSIGYPKWLGFTIPTIKAMFRRNYKLLMSDDIPMRSRRGDLRKLGYRFFKTTRQGESYEFEDASNVQKNSVQLPEGAPRKVSINYNALLGDKQEAYFGDIGLLGFRLVREGPKVTIFPRACPHEGASLDGVDCSKGYLHCFWHGRRIRPVGSFNWMIDSTTETSTHRIQAVDDHLTIELLENKASLAAAE